MARDKTEDGAEQAYAAAAARTRFGESAKPVKAAKAGAKQGAKAPASKAAAKAVAPPAPAVEVAAAPVAEVLAPEPAIAAASEPAEIAAETVAAEASNDVPAPIEITPPKLTISELKEKIMASAKNSDFTQPVADAVTEIQTRAKVAYEKGTEALTEATEFAKGNVEALVESGKIFAAGAQDFGKGYVEEAKSAYETLTADLKEMAAIKSPTELFQLQGKIARRNFDAFVAASSKNTEALVKLASDSFAPLSGRVNVAAEKLAKVA